MCFKRNCSRVQVPSPKSQGERASIVTSLAKACLRLLQEFLYLRKLRSAQNRRCSSFPKKMFASFLVMISFRGRKRHINIWHINNFSVTPVTDPRGRVPDPPGRVPDENVYIPWVPHTSHKLLTPGHRSGDPWPPGRETPPPTRAVTG